MSKSLWVQGRSLSAEQIQSIGQLIADNAHWSRWRLSRELSRRWDWRNEAGELKDMAARSLLLKLEQRGLIALPARRRRPTNRMGLSAAGPVAWDQQPIASDLHRLQPLKIREVSTTAVGRRIVRSALAQFHYLGYGGAVGENLQYVVSDGADRLLACLSFGSAAWKCQARDQWLGWAPAQRASRLNLLTNNARFLILPWVRVPHLASWTLSQVLGRLSADWQNKYGHRIVLVETFVERPRFTGTVYQAANWIKVGATAGRSRQDRHHALRVPFKDVYLYALDKQFRQRLCA